MLERIEAELKAMSRLDVVWVLKDGPHIVVGWTDAITRNREQVLVPADKVVGGDMTPIYEAVVRKYVCT